MGNAFVEKDSPNLYIANLDFKGVRCNIYNSAMYGCQSVFIDDECVNMRYIFADDSIEIVHLKRNYMLYALVKRLRGLIAMEMRFLTDCCNFLPFDLQSLTVVQRGNTFDYFYHGLKVLTRFCNTDTYFLNNCVWYVGEKRFRKEVSPRELPSIEKFLRSSRSDLYAEICKLNKVYMIFDEFLSRHYGL